MARTSKDSNTAKKEYGQFRGIVTNNDDPEERQRLRLQVPGVTGEAQTGWAEAQFRVSPDDMPDVGDSVWVTYEKGDIDKPVWTGTSMPEAIVTVSDAHYVHYQGVAAEEWIVNHGLGKRPAVNIVDSGDNVVVGDIAYLDNNTLRLTFDGAFSGKAYCN